MPQYIPVDYDPYDPTQTAQRLRAQGHNVAPNGLVYQGNPQADLEAAKNTLYGMTGIPDLQAAWAAYRRGETLPAIGQGMWGAANLATLAAPAAKALQPGLRALPAMLEDISGAQSVKNALGKVVPPDNPLLGTQKGVSNTLMAPQEQLAAKLDQIDTLQQPLPMKSGNFFRRKVEEVMAKRDPIRAYHGSPHDFEAFDINKIGTGEGAQAYGHGLYFAEHEPVARNYRDILSGYSGQVEQNSKGEYVAMLYDNKAMRPVDRQVFENENTANSWLKEQLDKQSQGRMYEVNLHADPDTFLHWDKPLSEQPPKVQEALQQIAQQYESGMPSERVMAWGEFSDKHIKPMKRLLDETLAGTPMEKFTPQLAEAALNDPKRWDISGIFKEFAPDKWPQVQQEIERYRQAVSPLHASGEEWYKSLVNAVEEHPGLTIRQLAGTSLAEAADVSELLRNAGISGIKYLDAGSRQPKLIVQFTGKAPEQGTAQDLALLRVEDHGDVNKAIEGLKTDLDTAKNGGYQSNISLYTDAINWLSRNKDNFKITQPDQTHNYVVFDPKIIEIVKKYGLAPLIAGGALTLSDNPAGAQHLVPVDHNPFIEPPPAQGGAVVPIAQPVAPQQLPFPFPVAPPPVYGDYIEPPR